jgi:hypothetical protein
MRARRTITAALNAPAESRNHEQCRDHGFGLIGHSLMKAALDGDLFVPVSISAIKGVETLAALLDVDSNHGRWSEPVGTKREPKKGRPVSSFGPPPQKPTRTFRHKASKMGGSAKTTARWRGHTHDTGTIALARPTRMMSRDE